MERTLQSDISFNKLINLKGKKRLSLMIDDPDSFSFKDWRFNLTEIDAFKDRYRAVVESILAYTTRECPETYKLMEFYNELSPEKMTNTDIFAELSWIVYSSGFRFDIIVRYWAALREAFHQFDVKKVAFLSKDLEAQAMRICQRTGFKNPKKAMWCIQNAQRIIELDYEKKHQGGLRGYLVEISKRNLFELVELAPCVVQELRFKGIGGTTVFHFMKNMGIDIFKPDIHVRRILTNLGLIDFENVPNLEICRAMSFLSFVSGMKISELDTLLFVYGRATRDSISTLCMLFKQLDANV